MPRGGVDDSPSGWWYQYSDGGWPVNRWNILIPDGIMSIRIGHLVTGWLTVGW